MRIDAHQHFWRLDRGDYRWLTPDLEAIHRDFLPEDLEPLLAECGIDRTVLVQAADTDAETDFLLSIAAETPFVAGVVGWVDLASRSAPGRIELLAGDPAFVGVRPMLQDLPDPSWILRAELAPALEALADLDLAFDALVRPVHLPALRELLHRHTRLRVVIDHAAKPVAAGFAAWRTHMEAIARDSSACCKLSGLSTDDLRPHLDVLLESFGPGRILWGSDWPVVVLAGGYGAWWRATSALLEDLAEDDRVAILGRNAARFYRIAERDVA